MTNPAGVSSSSSVLSRHSFIPVRSFSSSSIVSAPEPAEQSHSSSTNTTSTAAPSSAAANNVATIAAATAVCGLLLYGLSQLDDSDISLRARISQLLSELKSVYGPATVECAAAAVATLPPQTSIGKFTPSGVTLPPVVDEKEYAPLWRRFLAWFVDNLIVNCLIQAVAFLVFPLTGFDASPNAVTTILALLTCTAFCAYESYFLSQRNGQTLGKRLLKIKVVKDDGTAVSRFRRKSRAEGNGEEKTRGRLTIDWLLM